MSKYLIYTLFALIANVSCAQVQGGVYNSNTVNEAPATEEELDSIRPETEVEDLEIQEDRSVLKKAKMAPRSKSLDMKSTEQTKNQKAELSEATYEFQQSKSRATSQRVQRSPSVDQQAAMDDAVDYLEANAPESFEYHYYKYAAGNYDISLVEHLNQAEKLRPDNADVQVQKAAFHLIKNENQQALTYLEKLIASGRLDKSLNSYAEDLLLSVPDGGVLITHGFDDTYSAMYSQLKDKTRKDVTIVSLDFMQSTAYRNSLQDDGFKLPSGEIIDVNYLKEFCELNEARKIAVSLTTPKEYFVPIQNNLYVAGLVFEFHSKDYDNLHRNEELWNSVLKKHLVYNANSQKTRQLSSNYLPMLLVLYKSYKENDKSEQLAEIDEATNKVSVQCNKYNTVRQLKDAY